MKNRMKNRKAMIVRVLEIIVAAMIIFSFAQGLITIAYANTRMYKPDVSVTILKNGQTTCSGDLFGKELWYPGKKVNGVLRIYNNFRTVALKDLNLKVTLNRVNEGVDRDTAYQSFLRNMKFTVKKEKLILFNETLFENRSLRQMAGAGAGNKKKESRNEPGMGYLRNNDFIDLSYSMYMDEKAGDELENLTATVEVLLDMEEGFLPEKISSKHIDN